MLWARHVALEGFGLEGLRRTRAACVLWCSEADAAPAALYLHAAGIGTLRCEGEPGPLVVQAGGVWQAPVGHEAFDLAGGVGEVRRFAGAVKAWRQGLPVAWAGAWAGGTWAGWFRRGVRCPACQGGGEAAGLEFRGASSPERADGAGRNPQPYPSVRRRNDAKSNVAPGPFAPPAAERSVEHPVSALTGAMAWAASCRVAAWLLMAAAGVRPPSPGEVVRFDEAGARVQVVEAGPVQAGCPVCAGE